jgi:hypothetical protein
MDEALNQARDVVLQAMLKEIGADMRAMRRIQNLRRLAEELREHNQKLRDAIQHLRIVFANLEAAEPPVDPSN